MEDETPQEFLILDWVRLNTEQVDDRLQWLRSTLTTGVDWGYCSELFTCVLKNQDSAVMYRMRWFDTNGQELVDKPTMMKLANNNLTQMSGEIS